MSDLEKFKRCWRCPSEQALQPIENFCRNGADSVCRQCRYALNAEWSKDNRDKLRPKRAQYMKAYRAAQKDKKSKKTPQDPLPEE